MNNWLYVLAVSNAASCGWELCDYAHGGSAITLALGCCCALMSLWLSMTLYART